MKIVGSRIPIHDAVGKVTGAALYTGDLHRPRMLHARLLLSKRAHAKILSIDTTAALAVEDVHLIFTCFNSPRKRYNSAKRFEGQEIPEDEQLFPSVVRFVGDRVAMAVAESPQAAERALRKITIEYEDLPAVFSLEEALRGETDKTVPPIHADLCESNRLDQILIEAGNPEKAFAEADFVLEDSASTPAVHHLALEPHCCLAECSADDEITVWSSTQSTFAIRLLLSEIFDRPQSQIRVIKPALGGAFGSKIPVILEPMAVLASLTTGRPVRLELSRAQAFIATRTRHASEITVKTGVSKDGVILGQTIDVLFNAGAYCTQSINVTAASVHDVVKSYKTQNIRVTGSPVYTNLPIAGAMRGYGSPQIYFALETHLDRLAGELRMDSTELRLKNLLEPSSLHPVYGIPLGNPRPLDCLERGKTIIRWAERKAEIDKEKEEYRQKGELPQKLRGLGAAMGTHGNGVFGVHLDFTAIRIKVNEDGSIIFHSGTHDMGNGSITVQKMVLAEELKTPFTEIRVVESDTENCPYNLGDYASRGVFVSAEAARRAAVAMRELILSKAAVYLGVAAEELDLFEDDIRHKSDGTIAISRKKFFKYLHQKKQEELTVTESYANSAGRTSYGAHLVEVEIDTESGSIEIVTYAAVHDAGRVLNHMGIEGQMEGAISMITGYALKEELRFDSNGKLKNGSLKTYETVSAEGMPKTVLLDFVEEKDLPGPYGGKSVGECSVVPGAPAIANAVTHALDTPIRSIPIRHGFVKDRIEKMKADLVTFRNHRTKD